MFLDFLTEAALMEGGKGLVVGILCLLRRAAELNLSQGTTAGAKGDAANCISSLLTYWESLDILLLNEREVGLDMCYPVQGAIASNTKKIF